MSGDLYCWGSSAFGQLGDPDVGAATTPHLVPDGASYLGVSAGGAYSCGVRASAEAWCWGFNQSGQLGNAGQETCLDPSDPDGFRRVACSPTPIRAAAPLVFTDIRASAQFTCGLTPADGVYCWGFGDRGQLGNGESGANYFSFDPVRVARQP
jgi:alpha-tubulin suppressor-like RCC1 family protein